MVKLHNLQILTERRKELRKNQTPQEIKLWWYLRDERMGIKFRRQHSVGGYILDFYCPKKKLIIELDGGVHKQKENEEYDRVRDKFFQELGYLILRFTNTQIEQNINEVLRTIKYHLV